MDKADKFSWAAETVKAPKRLWNLQGLSATQIGTAVYIFGGNLYRKFDCSDLLFKFNLQDKTFTRLRLPEDIVARQRLTTFYAGDYIYFYGGEEGRDLPLKGLFRFNVLDEEVERCVTVGAEPGPAEGISGDYIESLDLFVVFGGRKAGGVCSNALYRLHEKRLWQVENALGVAPRERFGHSSCCVEKSSICAQIFMFGGAYMDNDDKMFLNDLHMLEYYNGAARWSEVQVLRNGPMARRRSTLSYYSGRLFLVGGSGATENMPGIDLYDFKSTKWYKFASSKSKGKYVLNGNFVPRADHATIALNDRMLILGGVAEKEKSRGIWWLKPPAKRNF